MSLEQSFSNYIEVMDCVNSYIENEKTLSFFDRVPTLYYSKDKALICGQEIIGFPTNLSEKLKYKDFEVTDLNEFESDINFNNYNELIYFLDEQISLRNTEYIKVKLKNSSTLVARCFSA
jgi:hypothetical protein